ncbi:hypothetical protein TWF281_006980 [Arthrobotrys megalospora]
MPTPVNTDVKERTKPYPHVLDTHRFRFKELCERELSIRWASVAFREQPDWTEKLKDRSFVVDWLRQRQQSDFDQYSDSDPTLKPLVWGRDDITMWFNELAAYKHYVRRLQKQGLKIEPDTEAVWRGDELVDEKTREELIDAAATLENMPEDQKLWRPHTNEMIFDLVDPSMWPIIYNQTTTPEGNRIDNYSSDGRKFSSKMYCWLPSEFEISGDGKNTKIASYINNLASPQEETVFVPILERVFTAFIPLFNHVLAEVERKLWAGSRCVDPTPWRSRVHDSTLIASKEACMQASKNLLDQMEKDGTMTDDIEKIGVPIHPKPKNNTEYRSMFPVKNSWRLISDAVWKPPKISRFNKLEGRTANVIVRMMNIELSPENPRWDGEEWHLDGTLNERIIATGVYYYAQENIGETYLALRRRDRGIQATVPIEIEWIKTKENRAIVYPNFYEHRIPAFSLIDKTKPGYSKLLIFYYCDPWQRSALPTTRIVLPQQPGQFEDMLRKSQLGSLPEEVFSQITSYLPLITITAGEAREHRLQMIAEKEALANSRGFLDDDPEDERSHYYGTNCDGYEPQYSSEDDDE